MKKGIHIIFNPIAGAGKAAKFKSQILNRFQLKLGKNFSFSETQNPGDAIKLAHEAMTNQAQLLIAIGGDGTINEVVNGIFEHTLTPSCELGIINCGSGGGLAQSLGLPAQVIDQIDLICSSPGKPLDIGLLKYTDNNGYTQQRYFINECQLGISAEIVARVGLQQKQLGGTLAFGLATILELLRFKAVSITSFLDQKSPATRALLGMVIGNGRYCAGGMQLTPQASPSDGRFDILQISEMNLLQRLTNFSKIYSGRHVFSKFFSIDQAKSLEIMATPQVGVETDGELLGKTPCSIRIIPDAIQIKY